MLWIGNWLLSPADSIAVFTNERKSIYCCCMGYLYNNILVKQFLQLQPYRFRVWRLQVLSLLATYRVFMLFVWRYLSVLRRCYPQDLVLVVRPFKATFWRTWSWSCYLDVWSCRVVLFQGSSYMTIKPGLRCRPDTAQFTHVGAEYRLWLYSYMWTEFTKLRRISWVEALTVFGYFTAIFVPKNKINRKYVHLFGRKIKKAEK